MRATEVHGRLCFIGPENSPRPARVNPPTAPPPAEYTMSLIWATSSPPIVTTGRLPISDARMSLMPDHRDGAGPPAASGQR